VKNIYRKTSQVVGRKIATWAAYRPLRNNRDEWEARYSSGWLEKYRQIDKLARYSIIIGYCHYFTQTPAILDVGCGQGILQERLHHTYRRYVGLDHSAKAIHQAAGRQDDRTVFITADASTYACEEQFDVIVFNECLYYFEDPLAVMRRYESFLQADGIFIVSIFEHLKTQKVWKILDSQYITIDSVRVRQKTGKTWAVKVFAPPRRAHA
jgi:2-polyprenyl-3-methyl-5-hydroxy-6-metoxy-1,4-benzoquinol methylase